MHFSMNILNVSIVFRIVLHVILEEPVLLVIMDFIGVQLVLEHQLNMVLVVVVVFNATLH